MSHLSDALSAIGYKSNEQKRSLLQLYHASGALTDGVVPQQILSDIEAHRFINEDRHNALKVEESKAESQDTTFTSPSEALEWFNQIGQDQRLRFRPTGTERQQMTTPKALEAHNEVILSKFAELGFLNEVIPPKPEVAALMILGAAQGGVSSRFNAAAQMVEEGKIKPAKIILVSGARDLWPANSAGTMRGETSTLDFLEKRVRESGNTSLNFRETLQAEFDQGFSEVDSKDGSQVVRARDNIAKSVSEKYRVAWPTEADMMEYLANQHPVLSKFEIAVVNAPKISVRRGQDWVLERPNTQSTLEETVRQHGQELMFKDVVVMSSQPHSKYQQGVVDNIMGQQYNVHMAAPGVDLKSVPPELVLVGGLEAVYAGVYSAKGKAKELLQEQEEQAYNARWQDYVRERGRQGREL